MLYSVISLVLALPSHAFCSALKRLVFRCSSLPSPLALVRLSMRFSFSGNMVKTNCLQLNITVKQTPAQGALKANHLSSASILVCPGLLCVASATASASALALLVLLSCTAAIGTASASDYRGFSTSPSLPYSLST